MSQNIYFFKWNLLAYRKPSTISPGLFDGLIEGGAYIRVGEGGGAYTWTIFCVSVIVINKYSNSDKQVFSIVIIVINSGNSDKQ
jgi:hypothetical protein